MPAIVDGGFCLTESHVIMKYLCNKKGLYKINYCDKCSNSEKGETSLYPTEPVARAAIDEALARVSDIKFGVSSPNSLARLTRFPLRRLPSLRRV